MNSKLIIIYGVVSIVVSTPAIVVDGVVKSSGKLLSINEVIKILTNH